MTSITFMFAAVTILAVTIHSAVAQKPFAFRDGDRVVFLGDSITQYGEHPLYQSASCSSSTPT
jgi:hypothetical protein